MSSAGGFYEKASCQMGEVIRHEGKTDTYFQACGNSGNFRLLASYRRKLFKADTMYICPPFENRRQVTLENPRCLVVHRNKIHQCMTFDTGDTKKSM